MKASTLFFVLQATIPAYLMLTSAASIDKHSLDFDGNPISDRDPEVSRLLEDEEPDSLASKRSPLSFNDEDSFGDEPDSLDSQLPRHRLDSLDDDDELSPYFGDETDNSSDLSSEEASTEENSPMGEEDPDAGESLGILEDESDTAMRDEIEEQNDEEDADSDTELDQYRTHPNISYQKR
ncbi:hypothetical protein IWQ62_000561 [Dispira parvispora]|uniref:Uncharacterized protein n=1 Tax=Dispira parvispora TaxID=1520584 RepID=A0A9W8AY45_9FUNG|nr:hypothetical protein IWQ62_000561 [Dispira parvispora]